MAGSGTMTTSSAGLAPTELSILLIMFAVAVAVLAIVVGVLFEARSSRKLAATPHHSPRDLTVDHRP